jgi:hypothetical protein
MSRMNISGVDGGAAFDGTEQPLDCDLGLDLGPVVRWTTDEVDSFRIITLLLIEISHMPRTASQTEFH